MPWDETDDYIRSGHKDPSLFQEGSFRTIDIDRSQGIKAVIGRPKGKTTTEVQSYLFEKAKGWTMAKAKEWFQKNASAEHGAKLSFYAAVLNLDAKSREATFYIMNTSKNRNGWGVTAEALTEGAPSIKNKPIGCGPDYKVDKHYPEDEVLDVGSFTGYDIPSSYMTATAKITDEEAWGKLESGEFGPISVVISSYSASCSECGAEINKEGYEHKCVKEKGAWIKVTSFKFDRVDFVEDPAYPQAGLMDMGASAQDTPVLQLVAAYYNGIDSEAERKRRKMVDKTIEQLQEELKSKDKTIQELQAQVKKLTGTDDESKTKKITELQAEVDRLKPIETELTTLKAEQHKDTVARCAKARFDAGLVTDLEEEKKRLADITDKTLTMLTEDAVKVKAKIKPRRAPKAGEDVDDIDETELETAFTATRARLGLKAKGADT